MKMITKCCICRGGIQEILTLPFEDILGMAQDYTQHVGLCKKCGFLFTMNPFSEKLLENRYKNESKFEYDSEEHILAETDEYVVRSKRNKQWIKDCIGDVGSVFEVGAASGYNLSLFWEAERKFGVEPSEMNCRLAKRNYGVDMFCGSFREFELSGNTDKWELIYMAMVLEHVVDPYSFLKSLKKHNSRYIFIEVPTMDIKRIDEPYGMMCEEHVNLFTFEALNSMLGRLGYGIVDAKIELGLDKGYPAGWPCIDTLWELGRAEGNYIPSVGVKGLIDDYISGSRKALLPVAKRIDSIPDSLPIAVWGTGHHVSMLLKNTNLGNKNIVKFYDSDRKKYKYTMHGKRIEAFDSEDIKSRQVKGIVIGTYIYQEVIHQVILDSVADMCEVFLLYDK